MNGIISMARTKKITLFVLVLAFFTLACINPKSLIDGTIKGISLSLNNIIPSLFPFFAVTYIIINSGIALKISKLFGGIMQKVFRISSSGSVVYLIGIIAGFPIAAATTSALYLRNEISKSQAQVLLAFCNNASFTFVTSVAGMYALSSFKIGVILFLIQLLSSTIYGIILSRCVLKKETSCSIIVKVTDNLSGIIISSIKTATVNIAYVCGFVIFMSGIAALLSGLISPFTSGLFEMTAGVTAFHGMQVTVDIILKVFFILTFSGVCVFLQIMAMIQKTDLSLKYFFLGKIIIPLFGGIIIILLSLFTKIFS